MDNLPPDGTIVKPDMPFLKALEGLNLDEAAQVDAATLVEIDPLAAQAID